MVRATIFVTIVAILSWVAYEGYRNTPDSLRHKGPWISEVDTQPLEVCNGRAVEAGIVVAYPAHRSYEDRVAASRPSFEDVFDVLQESGPSETVGLLYRRFVLPLALDYDEITIEPERRLAPGECTHFAAEFRRGRERFFVATRNVDTDEAAYALKVARAAMDEEIADAIPSRPETGNDELHGEVTSGSLGIRLDPVGIGANRKTVFAEQVPVCEITQSNVEFSPGTSPATLLTPISAASLEQAVEREFACAELSPDGGYQFLLTTPGLDGAVEYDATGHVENLPAVLEAAKKMAAAFAELKAEEEAERRALADYEEKLRLARIAEAKRRDAAIREQVAFRKNWTGVAHPYLLFSLSDSFGGETIGVEVDELVGYDTWGQYQSIPTGALIVSINGHDIYGVENAYAALFRHAQYLYAGIEKPLLIEYLDGAGQHFVSVNYIFNPAYYGTNHAGEAIWYGWLDGFSGGAGATSNCALDVAGRTALNGLSGGAEVISSLFENRAVDWSAFSAVKYQDWDWCRWRAIQTKAMARQFNPDTYENAALSTMLMPGGVRMLATKGLRRQAVRVLGRTRIANALTTGALEALETVALDIGMAPPTTPFEEKVRSSKNAALFAAVTGGAMGSLAKARP